ncbi:hypothetical protein DYU05_09195 [Mucilaginibacter terrenus]|uniref:Uncharacterized protein n=1 Tax=Mucilaginibacter terrenus TaxID=2482727 RepID=A0A3E2NXV7_9SPHI|nr:hypothetical protein DYU05_09195 [Mucilaginibacter terrenus]
MNKQSNNRNCVVMPSEISRLGYRIEKFRIFDPQNTIFEILAAEVFIRKKQHFYLLKKMWFLKVLDHQYGTIPIISVLKISTPINKNFCTKVVTVFCQ